MKITTIARSPTCDDSGDAANENIVNRWDLEGFRKPYLDVALDQFGGDNLTPLEITDSLDGYAGAVGTALPGLQSQIGDKFELQDLLWDLESMVSLGRYYADKQRCAAE